MCDSQSVLRRARILMMMEAVEHAGLTPMAVVELHAYAYLANVLSPVWALLPQQRAVLHLRGGPYYPEFQSDVDALVGRGLIGIQGVKHVRDADDGRWRLEGAFYLANYDASDDITTSLRRFHDENKLFAFYRELAFAFAVLSEKERDTALSEDATYALDVGEEVVIDFAQWKQANYSENAALFFDKVMPDGQPATSAQKLHLYAHHLKRRLAIE